MRNPPFGEKRESARKSIELGTIAHQRRSFELIDMDASMNEFPLLELVGIGVGLIIVAAVIALWYAVASLIHAEVAELFGANGTANEMYPDVERAFGQPDNA